MVSRIGLDWIIGSIQKYISWLFEVYMQAASWIMEGEWYEVVLKIAGWIGILLLVRSFCFTLQDTPSSEFDVLSYIVLAIATLAWGGLMIVALWLVFS